MSLLSKKTLAKKLLTNKSFRKAFVYEHIKRSIPFQIRTMRTERKWSQAKAGEMLSKQQNAISRLESPAYGKMNLQTLMEVAEGFDVGLLIKFVPFSRLVKEYEDVSFESLSAKSVSDKAEAQKLEAWAASEIAAVQAQTSARHLRGLDSSVETTAVQRSLTFDTPQLAVDNTKTATPNQPLSVSQGTTARPLSTATAA